MISSAPGEGTHLKRGSIIRVRGEDTDGVLAVYETTMRPGSLIEPHTHRNDVWVYVLTGTTHVLVGDEIASGGPGTFLLKPRDVVHAMWNEGATASRIYEILTPGGAERFFEDSRRVAEGDEAGMAAVRERHGLVFLPEHPRLAELRARVAARQPQPGVHVGEATSSDRATLESLMQLYLYDLAPYAHEGHRDVGPDGRFAYGWLDRYWVEPERHAFLIEADGAIAGFALVNQHALLGAPAHAVAEFFILRKYRGSGVGRRAAHEIFDRFPGRWEVAQDSPNVDAQRFWRATIDSYTGGAFDTHELDDERWRGPVLTFTSPPAG